MIPEIPSPKGIIFSQLMAKADYALHSRSQNLVYECHGMTKMARQLEAITRQEAQQLNDKLVVHGLNDPEYCRRNYGGVLE